MSTHEKLSPSGRHKFKNCPGSVREEAKWPNTSSMSSIDGTHTHTVIEHSVKDGLVDPFMYLGTVMKDHEGSFLIDSARCERAKFTIDYVKSVIEKYPEGSCEVIAERKVNPEYLIGRNDMKGTVDITIITPDMIEIVDHKDGMSDARESARLQMEPYAVGVLAEYKIPRGKPYPFRKVRMTMSQPKLALKNMNPLVSWDLDVDYVVDTLVGELVVEGQRCDDPNAPLVAGELQCKYCRNKTCTERYKTSMDALSIIPMVDISTQSANKDPAQMSDKQLAEILEAEPLITTLLKSAKEEAEKRLKSGISVPGFKLVEGRGSRAWALSEGDIADKLKKMGIPKDCLYESKLVSPAKAEKLVWEKRDGTKAQLSARQIKTLNTEYVAALEGKPTVAPASDDRPAISFSAESLFSPVGDAPNNAPSIFEASVSTVETALPYWLS